MKVINNRNREIFKGSKTACIAFLRGMVEQFSDGNLNPWITLEYTDTKVVYTNDNKTVTFEIVK